ncbi:MAG: HdeA/HdeB family chaperone [Xanthobacteraceae bacterium]|jgi:HdeA/HdeB family
MRRRFALAALGIALQITGFGTIAHAQDKLPCEAFARLGDGSWQALTTILIPDRQFKVQEGSLWRPGATVMGMDLATTLDKQCPNAPVGLPQGAGVPAAPAASGIPAASIPPQQPQPPRTLLERYSDANGNIDARQLTCGELDDTSADESALLLAWYSGWYSGAAKKREANLPRVRYAIRNVLDYCRTNREKNLSDVIQLMLK